MDNILDKEEKHMHMPEIILWFHGIEGLSVALFVLSILWKLMSWPYANSMIMGCLGLAAILTVMSPFYALKAYPKKPQTYIALGVLWSIATLYISLLFGYLYWPYADVMRMAGTIPVWVFGYYFMRHTSGFSKRSIEGWLVKRMYFRMTPALFVSIGGIILILRFIESLF